MLHIKEGNQNRHYLVYNDDRLITELDLINHSVSNKFEIIIELIKNMSINLEGFESWFTKLIEDYIKSEYDSEILLANISKFQNFSRLYIEYKEVCFDKFVNLDKKSKTSIVFYPDDIRLISTTSTALKLYSLFSCDSNLRLPDNLNRKVYGSLIQPCIDHDITTRIFRLIRSRTYRSSITDKYMWEFIGMMISETPESYVMTVFNFLMKSILILVDVEQNPIPFLVKAVDDSIKWLMRSVYKDRIIYGEVFPEVEVVFGSALTKENFYLYCCQDVVGKAAKIGMDLLEAGFGLTEEEFNKARDRLDNITYLYPSAYLITLPIVSKVLEIPYKFLLTIPPKHAVLMGIFMYELSKDILDNRFPILCEFLVSCPKNQNIMATRSSYKVRNLELVLNDNHKIFGFGNKVLKFEIMSLISGILSASKKNLVSLFSGKQLTKMTYFNLENDVCMFFSELYSSSLDPVIATLRKKADAYF